MGGDMEKSTLKPSYNDAYYVAFRDISEYIRNEYKEIINRSDIIWYHWIVTPSFMKNAETRRLNAELGIKNINYFGNKNGIRKNHSKQKRDV